jgi:hypothetical protein
MDTAATSSSQQDVTLRLELLAGDVARFDVGGLDAGGVVGLLATVRDAQRALDGLVVRLGLRAGELAESGDGGDAREVLVRGVRACTARRETARVRVASRWPAVADASSRGTISADHVDSLARRLSGLTDEQQALVDVDGLVDRGCRLPADTFDAVVKQAVDDIRGDGGLGDTQQRRAASAFRHWYDEQDGMGRFRGALDPERYEGFVAAIEAHMNTIAAQDSEPVTKDANLAARALHELVTGNRAGGRPVPAAGFVIDYQSLTGGRRHDDAVCETVDGRDLPVESVGRLLCDAVLRRIVLDDRGVLVHEGGWTVRLQPDRRLEIHRPDGTLHAITPPPTRTTVQRE